jgi:hypothetical protein
MFTIHTNLLGAVAKIREKGLNPPLLPTSPLDGVRQQLDSFRGKEGEIAAVYLGSDSLPRFLLSMNPSTSHKSKHPLVEVIWSDVEWVKPSEKTKLLVE